MIGSYKKLSIKTPAPKKTSGLGKFAHVSNPKLAPLKTRTYTKSAARADPMEFGSIGFGGTGLNETPSLLGMAKSSGGI